MALGLKHKIKSLSAKSKIEYFITRFPIFVERWPHLNYMDIFKQISDFIYGTGRIRRKYLKDHPKEYVLIADATKVIMTKGEKDITKGFDWVTSKRAVVLLTDKRIKCGQWNIPLDKIANAQLVKINSLFSSGQVLKITTVDNDNFQFGMQSNQEWLEQDVLLLKLEKGKVKYSLYSIIVRLILAGLVIYWIMNK